MESGGQVVALVHLHARGLGSRFDIEDDIADVFEVDDGKISKLRLYVHRDTALAQAKRLAELPAAFAVRRRV